MDTQNTKVIVAGASDPSALNNIGLQRLPSDIKDAEANIRRDVAKAEADIRADVLKEGQENMAATKDAECHIVDISNTNFSIIRERLVGLDCEVKATGERVIKELGKEVRHYYEVTTGDTRFAKLEACCCENATAIVAINATLASIVKAVVK